MSQSLAAPRMAWPDVAKGLSILGVILLHVTLAVPEAENTTLALANKLTDPLRMPLFFLISGLFATKIFRFSFLELFTRRLWFFLVPYLIWVPVETYLKHREYLLVHAVPMPPAKVYLEALVFGVNMAWFLYALVLFNIALWLTRKLPVPWALAASLLPVVALPLHMEFHMIGKAVLYLPIFFLGAYLRRMITSFGQRVITPVCLAATLVVYLAGLALFIVWAHVADSAEMSIPWPLPGAQTIGVPEIELLVRLGTHVLMLPAGITLAVLLSKIPVVSQSLQFIGRNTLPVYLGHPIALTLFYHFTQYRLQLPISAEPGHWIASTGFWMMVAVAVSLLGGIALWALTRVPLLGWSIAPPPIDGPWGRKSAPVVSEPVPASR